MLEQALVQNTAKSTDSTFSGWEIAGRRAVMRFDMNERTAGPMPSFGSFLGNAGVEVQSMKNAYAPEQSMAQTAKEKIAYENTGDDFSFNDVLDMINPLQHLPVIGMLYRNITGDQIKPMSNIIGGAVFGGPVGAVINTLDSIVRVQTGKDFAQNALSFMGFDVGSDPSPKPALDYPTANAGNVPSPNRPSTVHLSMGEAAYTQSRNFAASTNKTPTQTWNA